MRVPSSRAATAALLIAALGVLLVAGRLLAPAPGVRPSSTTSATTTSVAVGISQRVRLPDLLGQRLAQATTTLHRLGLEGRQMNLACVALDHGNPADAVVVAQNPHAGESAPAAVWSPCVPGPTCNPTTPPAAFGWALARAPRPT
jgi:hypothetical protein